MLYIRAGTLLSIALRSLGATTEANNLFQSVIETSEPSRCCRSILDQGPAVATLLYELKDPPVRCSSSEFASSSYVDELRQACHVIHPEPDANQQQDSTISLSERDLEIVTLLARGQSNKQIARSLGIAPETVKWYLKRIYLKLEVDRRAQAVARAHTLGLIDLA